MPRRSARITVVPLRSVVRVKVGNLSSGNVAVFGTPRVRSTSLAVVVKRESGAGSVNGDGVTAGSSAITVRSPGVTTNVWLALASHRSPVARTFAGVASAHERSVRRKHPGSFA